ncbi:Netrin receptor unc-5 [Intoshia linei]|uniref:Netrin receptor unc-5 n=1 Tax=Intoshia linei TaxID=1819745 RepID=A0A177B0S4_9BILA|nr:Netrin receptor unc-5 [Intoshia linei]
MFFFTFLDAFTQTNLKETTKLISESKLTNIAAYKPKFITEPLPTYYIVKRKPVELICRAYHAMQILFKCAERWINTSLHSQKELHDPINNYKYIETRISINKEDVEDYFGENGYWCKCFAYNKVAESGLPLTAETKKGLIHIAYIKKRFSLDPLNTQLKLNSFLELKCIGPQANPKANITWYLADEPIKYHTFDNVAVSKDNNLIIQNFIKENVGKYTCVAENIAARRYSKPAIVSLSEENKWSEWTSWSPCSKICGEGLQYRERYCQVSLDKTFCSGHSREEKKCRNQCKDGYFNIPSNDAFIILFILLTVVVIIVLLIALFCIKRCKNKKKIFQFFKSPKRNLFYKTQPKYISDNWNSDPLKSQFQLMNQDKDYILNMNQSPGWKFDLITKIENSCDYTNSFSNVNNFLVDTGVYENETDKITNKNTYSTINNYDNFSNYDIIERNLLKSFQLCKRNINESIKIYAKHKKNINYENLIKMEISFDPINTSNLENTKLIITPTIYVNFKQENQNVIGEFTLFLPHNAKNLSCGYYFVCTDNLSKVKTIVKEMRLVVIKNEKNGQNLEQSKYLKLFVIPNIVDLLRIFQKQFTVNDYQTWYSQEFLISKDNTLELLYINNTLNLNPILEEMKIDLKLLFDGTRLYESQILKHGDNFNRHTLLINVKQKNKTNEYKFVFEFNKREPRLADIKDVKFHLIRKNKSEFEKSVATIQSSGYYSQY